MNEKFIKECFNIKDNNLIITINDRNSYLFCKVKELLNPKYAIFERCKLVLKKIIECSGCSSIASQQSCNYDNMLMILAIITERVEEGDLEIWKQRLFSKRGIL